MDENVIKKAVALLLLEYNPFPYQKGTIIYHKNRPNDKDIIEDFRNGKYLLSGSTVSVLDISEYRVFKGEDDLFVHDYVRTHDDSPSCYQIIKKFDNHTVLLRSIHGDGEEKIVPIKQLLLECGKPMFPKL